MCSRDNKSAVVFRYVQICTSLTEKFPFICAAVRMRISSITSGFSHAPFFTAKMLAALSVCMTYLRLVQKRLNVSTATTRAYSSLTCMLNFLRLDRKSVGRERVLISVVD